jgi:hypothetical protein
VSGFSPVTLSFLGVVFVAALCLSILAVRRDHSDHVHTLWHIVSVACQAIDLLCKLLITSKALSERPELIADPSTARQQQIRFVPAPLTLRFGFLLSF